MASEIKAPQFPESVADGTVATWHKKPGEKVSRDELLVDIETDKVVLEVVAPSDGSIQKILKPEGETVVSLEPLAVFEQSEGQPLAGRTLESDSVPDKMKKESPAVAQPPLGPAARRMLSESQISLSDVSGSGRGGRVTKEDVVHYLKSSEAPPAPKPSIEKVEKTVTPLKAEFARIEVSGREEKRVPMTRLRSRIAERLMEAKNNTAMLTTFNEVNMQPIMNMRKHYRESFEKHHKVKLGFMSFFVRASIEALKRFPTVNASIDGNDIVYHGYYDVGVAVSTERGLVVPVLRDADRKSFAEIEQQIIDFGTKAREGKLAIEDMKGGTFSISNGGVFGSLLSTPILNPPQTAILGMHKTQERPMAVNGKVEILPMMYLALSYDHRLIDGREAVQFLVTIKEFVEDPSRLLLDI